MPTAVPRTVGNNSRLGRNNPGAGRNTSAPHPYPPPIPPRQGFFSIFPIFPLATPAASVTLSSAQMSRSSHGGSLVATPAPPPPPQAPKLLDRLRTALLIRGFVPERA